MKVDFFELTTTEQIEDLLENSHHILEQYDLRGCLVESINYEYNATFAVTSAEGDKFALRVNINSPRTIANVKGEVSWVNHLQGMPGIFLPAPILNSSGSFVTQFHHQRSGRNLLCVLNTWVDGEELGDEVTLEQATQVGKLMARLHDSSIGFEIPDDAALPNFSDPMWESKDCLLDVDSPLDAYARALITLGLELVMKLTEELYSKSKPQLIHGDFHGWNMKTLEGDLYILDFDDCGFGLPVQDLSVAIYYLDTAEQVDALLAGYSQVRDIPPYSERHMQALLLHRRLMLLNYLYETQNQEHQEMGPAYLEESLRRVEKFISQADFSGCLTEVRGLSHE